MTNGFFARAEKRIADSSKRFLGGGGDSQVCNKFRVFYYFFVCFHVCTWNVHRKCYMHSERLRSQIVYLWMI